MSLSQLVTDLDNLSARLLYQANQIRGEDSLNFANAHIADARNLIAAVATRVEPHLHGATDEETRLKQRIAELEARVAADAPDYIEPPAIPLEAQAAALEAKAALQGETNVEQLHTDRAGDLIPGPDVVDEPDPEQMAREQATADAMNSAPRQGDPPEPGWG